MVNIDWGTLAYGSVCVVAWVEWVKGFTDGELSILKSIKNIKFHIWRFASPIVAFIVAIIMGGSWPQILVTWQGIFALAQLGYQAIIANVNDLIKKRVA